MRHLEPKIAHNSDHLMRKARGSQSGCVLAAALLQHCRHLWSGDLLHGELAAGSQFLPEAVPFNATTCLSVLLEVPSSNVCLGLTAVYCHVAAKPREFVLQARRGYHLHWPCARV